MDFSQNFITNLFSFTTKIMYIYQKLAQIIQFEGISMATILQTTFSIAFHEWRVALFDSNFTEVCS